MTFIKNGSNTTLVFTSAGDNTQLESYWFTQRKEDGKQVWKRNFDVCIAYYGTEERDRYKKYCDYYLRRKGSKFQNFWFFYWRQQKLISQYEYIFIVDDDIVIHGDEIEKCFEYAQKHDLWICQPSFKTPSKISWGHTKYNPHKKITYTNFCEMNVPIFSKMAICEVMKAYDPILVGLGTDLLYSQTLINHPKYTPTKMAILHDVQCINPHEDTKKNTQREIDKCQSQLERLQTWETWAKNHGYVPNGSFIRVFKITQAQTHS